MFPFDPTILSMSDIVHHIHSLHHPFRDLSLFLSRTPFVTDHTSLSLTPHRRGPKTDCIRLVLCRKTKSSSPCLSQNSQRRLNSKWAPPLHNRKVRLSQSTVNLSGGKKKKWVKPSIVHEQAQEVLKSTAPPRFFRVLPSVSDEVHRSLQRGLM